MQSLVLIRVLLVPALALVLSGLAACWDPATDDAQEVARGIEVVREHAEISPKDSLNTPPPEDIRAVWGYLTAPEDEVQPPEMSLPRLVLILWYIDTLGEVRVDEATRIVGPLEADGWESEHGFVTTRRVLELAKYLRDAATSEDGGDPVQRARLAATGLGELGSLVHPHRGRYRMIRTLQCGCVGSGINLLLEHDPTLDDATRAEFQELLRAFEDATRAEMNR